jgi:hypothetical protein
LHCIYHDPERTIPLFHPRTACSLQFYAPEDDTRIRVSTFHTRRSNDVHSWWLQRFDIVGSQLGITHSCMQEAASSVQHARPHVFDRETARYHLANFRSVIPHHDVLDEEEFIREVQPLVSPWSWPPNTYYREAHRGYTRHLTEPLIEELVTHGLLLANEIGIRWKHLDQYVLLKTEEPVLDRATRPQFDRAGARIFRRPKNMQAEATKQASTISESLATPLVGLDAPPLDVGEKKVRLCAKSTYILSKGEEQMERVEDVTDNEGKTAMMLKDERKVRKWKMSGICWDSDWLLSSRDNAAGRSCVTANIFALIRSTCVLQSRSIRITTSKLTTSIKLKNLRIIMLSSK